MRYLIIFFTVVLYAYVGSFKEIKGGVELFRNGKTLTVHSGMGIDVNDTVFTHENAKAKIVFKDNTVITIGQNSTFKVKEYLYGGKPKARFGFLKGTFVSVTGKIGKIAPKRFKLETKNASIGIRGTTVFGEIYYSGDVIGCSSGAISVTKGGKTVLLKPGEMVGVFGSVVTKPIKTSVGYLKSIFSKLSLSRDEEAEFFSEVLNKNRASKNAEVTAKDAVPNKNLQPENGLTWGDYVIDNNIPFTCKKV